MVVFYTLFTAVYDLIEETNVFCNLFEIHAARYQNRVCIDNEACQTRD
jgi:hypothetical protein